MNESLIRSVVLLAAFVAVLEWWRWRRFDQRLKKLEAAYDAEFDLAAWQARLDDYVLRLRAILPPFVFEAPSITAVNFNGMQPVEMARSAVDHAAQRFGLAMPAYTIELTSNLTAGRDGEVLSDGPWDIQLTNDRLIVGPAPGRDPNWRVRLRDGLQHEPERLAVVAAHEIAHVALLGRGIRLEPEAENELFTDAAAVLAGFGLLMERTVFTLKTNPLRGGERKWYFVHTGYLHRGAVNYLQSCRDALTEEATA